MANTTRPPVRDAARATRDTPVAGRGRAPDGDVDPRVARTTAALGRAVVALLEERAFDAITVQDILDRAGVGRTAFYAHYRNKHDVLFSNYEGLLAAFADDVDRPSPYGSPGTRLFPVAEFVAHVGEVPRLVHALTRDGLVDDAWAMLAGEAGRLIARRLGAWAAAVGAPRDGSPDWPSPVWAPMLAGALVESVRWWQAHPDAATPAEVDAAFHQLARGILRRWDRP